MTTLKQLIERKEKAEAELAEVEAEIASRAGETDESLDPDPAKAAPTKAAAVKKG